MNPWCHCDASGTAGQLVSCVSSCTLENSVPLSTPPPSSAPSSQDSNRFVSDWSAAWTGLTQLVLPSSVLHASLHGGGTVIVAAWQVPDQPQLFKEKTGAGRKTVPFLLRDHYGHG